MSFHHTAADRHPSASSENGSAAMRLRRDVSIALMRDFRVNGQYAIDAVRESDPAAYLRIVALLALSAPPIGDPLDGMTDDELHLLLEVINAHRHAREQ